MIARSGGCGSMATWLAWTLALAIAANATVFSLVDGVLLRPLPFPDSHELVWVAERGQSGRPNWVTWANFRDWRADSRSFSGLAAFAGGSTTVRGGETPEVDQVRVSPALHANAGSRAERSQPVHARSADSAISLAISRTISVSVASPGV